jgi:protein-tyrosine phosphatase
MVNILMVCLGNICRSPLAEGILKKKLFDAGITYVKVNSAGTAGFHIGEHPDKRSVANALRNGVDISSHLGRQFHADDFDMFDLIYVMDSSNYSNVTSLARSESEQLKVKMILNELHPGKNESVPDPYFGGEEGFEEVFLLLDTSCDIILSHYQPTPPSRS